MHMRFDGTSPHRTVINDRSFKTAIPKKSSFCLRADILCGDSAQHFSQDPGRRPPRRLLAHTSLPYMIQTQSTLGQIRVERFEQAAHRIHVARAISWPREENLRSYVRMCKLVVYTRYSKVFCFFFFSLKGFTTNHTKITNVWNQIVTFMSQ